MIFMSEYDLSKFLTVASTIRQIREGKILVCSDVDGTLCLPREKISLSMATNLIQYLDSGLELCIISAQTFEAFLDQVISPILSIRKKPPSGIHAFLEQGGVYYRFLDDEWKMMYEFPISEVDKQRIARTIKEAVEFCGYTCDCPAGNVFQYRKCLVTYSALGDKAKREDKIKWDPDRTKRRQIVERCKKAMPEFQFGIGGTTSVDATIKGRDKSFAIKMIAKQFGVKENQLCYIGDETSDTGNDYPVVISGVPTLTTRGPDDTERFLRLILSS